jgi:hypothetical protein
MTKPISQLRGVVRGKTVELMDEPNVPDGQAVLVTIEPAPETTSPAGEGLKRYMGAWADESEELEEYLEWNRRQRGVERRDSTP